MRKFLIKALHDNRLILREVRSKKELEETLLTNYAIEYEVLDGINVPPVLPDGLETYTYLTYLLHTTGPQLKDWLISEGFVPVRQDKDLSVYKEDLDQLSDKPRKRRE